jgi:hypothetical protein
MYQQSQQRLAELETRINLCNNQKVKKKPRPESSYTTGNILFSFIVYTS